nr:MAG TPA: hypothetical protein [Caudoviricetes sp.]
MSGFIVSLNNSQFISLQATSCQTWYETKQPMKHL